MVTAVNCVPIMCRDRSAVGVNLDTGGCQRTDVKVRVHSNISEPLNSAHLDTQTIRHPVVHNEQ